MSSANPAAKTAIEVAAEAEFQLKCAHSFITWFGAITRSMESNVEHRSGADNDILIGLCRYLVDDACPGIESAISEFGALSVNSVGGVQ